MCGSWISGWPFGGMMSGLGRGGMFLPFLLGFTIFVLVVILIATLIRADRTSERVIPSDRAFNILNERYARGEITQEEYQRMKKDIR